MASGKEVVVKMASGLIVALATEAVSGRYL
jgi:hypothetical protein